MGIYVGGILSDISKGANKITKCALSVEVNVHSQWSCPPPQAEAYGSEHQVMEGLLARHIRERN